MTLDDLRGNEGGYKYIRSIQDTSRIGYKREREANS